MNKLKDMARLENLIEQFKEKMYNEALVASTLDRVYLDENNILKII